MINDHKKPILIIFTAFFIIILASFQISFLNNFIFGLNIFLILILFLVINKNIYGALLVALFGGLLIDAAHFSVFGSSSLILLLLTFFLAVFQKQALITAKNEGLLIMAIAAVIFYHFFEWAINYLFISNRERISFYVFNYGILLELAFTVIILLAIMSFKNKHIFNNV